MIGRFFKNYGVIFVLAFAADRITKYFALLNCKKACTINQFLTFQLTINRGISWGMFHSNNNMMFFVITGLIILITAGLLFYTFIRWLNGNFIGGEILVLAGSISNIIDRFLYDGVIDFILISHGGWSFPIFNIADVCIVFGVGLMALELYKKS